MIANDLATTVLKKIIMEKIDDGGLMKETLNSYEAVSFFIVRYAPFLCWNRQKQLYKIIILVPAGNGRFEGGHIKNVK